MTEDVRGTRWRVGVAAIAVGMLLATACSSDSSGDASPTPAESSSDDAGAITVSQKDFEIVMSTSSASAGDVQFAITNDGPSAHEFVVVKSDVAPDALPVVDGLVPEEGLDVIGEAEDIAPGTSPTLELSLEAGSYIVLCNIVGHYEQGMSAGLTVA
jgi:uncharacterized cupredoxin-like copper-binding protein